jgi:hypothetical protein
MKNDPVRYRTFIMPLKIATPVKAWRQFERAVDSSDCGLRHAGPT